MTRKRYETVELIVEEAPYLYNAGRRGTIRYGMTAVIVWSVRESTIAITETRYEHIVLTQDDSPLISGTTMKVIELVLEKQASGWSAEELHFQFPYLSLGQIYSALVYYADHREELDRDIQRRLTLVDELRAQAPETALHARVRAQRGR